MLSTASSNLFLRVVASKAPPAPDWPRVGANMVNWQELTAVALFENSITLLQDRMAALPRASVPPEVRANVASLSLVWTFKLKHLERRLAESVIALSNAGIEVTLIKGAALALTVYPKFTDRPMADIDMMVDPSRADEAWEILRQSGWDFDTSSRPLDNWANHHHLPPLDDKTGSGLRLELHTAPLSPGHPFQLSREDMLASARRLDLGRVHVLVPDRHLHAVHAAIHFGYSHQFESGGLNFFRDMTALSTSSDWSWRLYIESARRSGAEACCYWSLRLAAARTDLVVPAEVLDALSPRLGDRIDSVLEEHFSQIILRAEHSCPSVELRHRMWAFALNLRSKAGRTSAHWLPEFSATRSSRTRTAIRRVGAHLRRAPQWSRYIARLVAPVLEFMP